MCLKAGEAFVIRRDLSDGGDRQMVSLERFCLGLKVARKILHGIIRSTV